MERKEARTKVVQPAGYGSAETPQLRLNTIRQKARTLHANAEARNFCNGKIWIGQQKTQKTLLLLGHLKINQMEMFAPLYTKNLLLLGHY